MLLLRIGRCTEDSVAKPEWGQKRACPGCGSRFYDLMHDPITCPNCGATVGLTVFSKTRRSRTVPAKPKVATAATVATAEAATEPDEAADVVADADDEEDDKDIIEDADDEEDDKDIIEDASELGEDDASEVVEGVEGNEADDR